MLFNLRTGKQASASTEEFLLNIVEEENKKRDDFVRQCLDKSCEFEKKITKTKILNFSTENFGKKNRSKIALKLAQPKVNRDLFGRIIYLSTKKQIALRKILEYPLLSKPACSGYCEGFISGSQKPKVQSFLKEHVNSHSPSDVDAVVVDGMFFVRSNTARFTTYQTFPRYMLKAALKMTLKKADQVFDVYTYTSLILKGIIGEIMKHLEPF